MLVFSLINNINGYNLLAAFWKHVFSEQVYLLLFCLCKTLICLLFFCLCRTLMTNNVFLLYRKSRTASGTLGLRIRAEVRTRNKRSRKRNLERNRQKTQAAGDQLITAVTETAQNHIRKEANHFWTNDKISLVLSEIYSTVKWQKSIHTCPTILQNQFH